MGIYGALILGVGYLIYFLRKQRKGEPSEPSEFLAASPVVLTVKFNTGNNRWEVLDDSGNLPGRMLVRREQTITWNIVGGTARFDFPTALFRKGNETKQRESSFVGQVSSNAPYYNTFIYAVFCDDGTHKGYAEGGTPPEMEVERY